MLNFYAYYVCYARVMLDKAHTWEQVRGGLYHGMVFAIIAHCIVHKLAKR